LHSDFLTFEKNAVISVPGKTNMANIILAPLTCDLANCSQLVALTAVDKESLIGVDPI